MNIKDLLNTITLFKEEGKENFYSKTDVLYAQDKTNRSSSDLNSLLVQSNTVVRNQAKDLLTLNVVKSVTIERVYENSRCIGHRFRGFVNITELLEEMNKELNKNSNGR